MLTRTLYCGHVREHDIGRDVVCCGWALNKRDMGGVLFLDLVDREGVLQIVANAEHVDKATFETLERVRLQSVLAVSGTITKRDPETINPKIATGTVELKTKTVEVLSEADPVPFTPDDLSTTREELRLEYRYLDLRRPRLYRNLKMRHTVVTAIRRFMDDEGFLDVETPMLTKSTPEGARDYLVPSRVHPGSFYALPQSPQIFKQLLMVGGIDKYYQIARCFRDEDLRADRQPEFTQLDLEMSFVDQEAVLRLLERLFTHIMKEAAGVVIDEAFPRLTWQACMDRFGSDKPDLRVPLEIVDITDLAQDSGFSVFASAVKKGGVVRALCIPDAASMARSDIESLTRFALDNGAQGMAWIAYRTDGELYTLLSKFIVPAKLRAIVERVGAKPGDFIVFSADTLTTVRHVLGRLRLEIARRRHLIREGYRFLIVTDFPMFEYNEEAGRYQAQHHPFTMPYVEDLPYLTKDPARVRSQAYDVVLNGVELGSGSLRIHDRTIQRHVLSALGLPDDEIESRFGFMLNAFRFGTPPHGGFAFGLDRFVMLLTGEANLREVIAFPKIKDASCPMTKAPSPVDDDQLNTLSIALAGDALSDAHTRLHASTAKPTFDINRIARLARLAIKPDETAAYADTFTRLLDLVSTMESLDTSDVPLTDLEPTRVNVFQDPSLTTKGLSADDLLANAPDTRDGFFFVHEVLECDTN